MKTVTTTAIQALIHQVLFDIGITKEGAYQIIQNNSINATMIIWDHCGMAEESIVQNFNEDVKKLYCIRRQSGNETC